MNNIDLSIRYNSPIYPQPMMSRPMYFGLQPTWINSPTNFKNTFFINTLLQILQQLILAIRTQEQHNNAPTPTTPSNKATILTSSNAQGMSEYHRHTQPGKPSPMVRHNQTEDYKEILVETPLGSRIVANPGPQIVAEATLANKLKQFFNISYSSPYTTTIYDNDRSGALSADDLIYMNDNVTGAQIKEHLLTAAEAKALGIS